MMVVRARADAPASQNRVSEDTQGWRLLNATCYSSDGGRSSSLAMQR